MLRGDPAREIYAEATRTFGNDDIYVIAMLTDDVFTQREPRGAAPHQRRGAEAPRRAARREPRRRADVPLGRREGVARRRRASSTSSRRTRRRSPTCACARSPIRSIPSSIVVARRLARPRSTCRSTRSATATSWTSSSTTRSARSRRPRAAPGARVPLRRPAAREVAHGGDHAGGPLAPDPARGAGRGGGRLPRPPARLRGVLLPLFALPDVGALDVRPARGHRARRSTCITLVLAPILISLGGLYGVHIVARWEEEREHVDNARDAALATLEGRVPARVPLRRDHHGGLRRADSRRDSGHRGARRCSRSSAAPC